MRWLFRFASTGLLLFCSSFILWGAPSAPTPASWELAAPVSAAASINPTGLSQNTAPATATSDDACLECHGSFDDLAKSTASYVAPSGEKGTPHRYVPHEKKDAKAIPGCSNCHDPHPVPPPSTMTASEASVDWCYRTCHHASNFKPCSECHK